MQPFGASKLLTCFPEFLLNNRNAAGEDDLVKGSAKRFGCKVLHKRTVMPRYIVARLNSRLWCRDPYHGPALINLKVAIAASNGCSLDFAPVGVRGCDLRIWRALYFS